MKINPIELTKIDGAYEASLKTGENRVAEKEDIGMARDRVCLSKESEKRGEAEGMITSAVQQTEQSTSPEKLRQIRTAIKNGTYRVSGEDIADAILGKL